MPPHAAHPIATDPSRDLYSFMQNSSLYQEFLAEREEILRHKWFLSEKAGYDVGFERALLDWCRHHRMSWRSARRRRQSNIPLNSISRA